MLGGKSTDTFFAIKQVVVILHRDELMPAILLGDVLQSLELPCRHLSYVSAGFYLPLANTYTASTYVTNLTTLNNVVQGPHDLLSRRVPIQPMNL